MKLKLGKIYKRCRIELNCNQIELAKKIYKETEYKVNASQISKYERNIVDPKAQYLYSLLILLRKKGVIYNKILFTTNTKGDIIL